MSHTLLWKKLPSRSSKVRASRIASTPGVLMADILRVGRVWRRHDVLDRNGAPPLSFCFWSHCPDLDCWTAFLRNHDVLIAPVIVSYPRGIVKSWLQSSLLFDLLVAPLGLGQHLLTELIHLAMEILACGTIHSKMAMVSVICTPLLASDPNLVALNCPFTSWTPLLSAPPFACGSYAGGFSGIVGWVLTLMTLSCTYTNAGSPSVFSTVFVFSVSLMLLIILSTIRSSPVLCTYTSDRIHACSCALVPPTTSSLPTEQQSIDTLTTACSSDSFT